MHITGVVRPEVGGARIARTSIAVLFFVFLTACGGGGSGGGGVPDAAPPASGSLDLSLSTDGIVTTTIPGETTSAAALALQPDGKIVVAGSATILGVENIALARYNTDGSLDTTFGPDMTGIVVTNTTPVASSIAYALALQPDGKIVVAGKQVIGAAEDFALARYDTNGALDGTFGTGGVVITIFAANSVAFALALQSDGKIVAAGNAGGDIALARYNSADGSLDTNFGPGMTGMVTTTIGTISSARALGIQTNGNIVVAGNADGQIALARYISDGISDGTLDGSFGTLGIVNTTIGTNSSNAFGLALQSDGKIVVAGNATNDGLAFVFALARYETNGLLDTSSFGTSGIVTTIVGATSSNAFALALQSDGKIVAAGNATNNGVNYSVALARYTSSSGALDTTFGTGGIVTTTIPGTTSSGAAALALQSDGKIVVAGVSDGSIALARYNP